MFLHLSVYQLLKKDFTKLTKIMIKRRKRKSNTFEIQDIEGRYLLNIFGGNVSLCETTFQLAVHVDKLRRTAFASTECTFMPTYP
jgi:hypothetical protein